MGHFLWINLMFTGIITNLGTISKKMTDTLTIKTDRDFLSKINSGISISVNGICLTVVALSEKEFKVETMPETIGKTNIKYLIAGAIVNLELPATSATFLSGHIVQGHVDGVGKIKKIKQDRESRIFTITVTQNIAKYIVEKGSITVNGISLTVIYTRSLEFTVGIIPYTLDNTMLHTLKAGDLVNIEVDILAKILEKLLKKNK